MSIQHKWSAVLLFYRAFSRHQCILMETSSKGRPQVLMIGMEYYIYISVWAVLQSRVPKVWHLLPKFKMVVKKIHFGLCFYSFWVKSVGYQNDIICLNTKKNEWKAISTAKRQPTDAHTLSVFDRLQYTTFQLVRHTSTRSPMLRMVMNGLNKQNHSFYPTPSRKHTVNWGMYIWPFADACGLIWWKVVLNHVSLVSNSEIKNWYVTPKTGNTTLQIAFNDKY